MALWQYTFHILTKESLCFFPIGINHSFDDYLFDDEPYWQYKPVNKCYFDEIGNILQKNKSWSKKINLYGDEQSNCFEVLFDGETNNVISVSFRIDYTSNYELVLREIIEFCVLKNLIILDENVQVLSLNYESIKSIIDNSPQVKRYKKLMK